MKKKTKSQAQAKRDRKAAKDLARECAGRQALRDRGLGIYFGDPLTPDELRSIYLMAEFARKNAPANHLLPMIPGMLWLSMLFDAGASMLPGDHFKKHHENLSVPKRSG